MAADSNRMTSLADRPIERIPMMMFPGRNARPTSSGVYPSRELQVQRAGEEEHANIAPAQSTPTTFDTATFQAEQPERNERRLGPRLDDEERREQCAGDCEETERPRGDPADLVAVHDRVNGEHERGGHRDRARDVELLRCRRLRADGIRTNEATTRMPTGTLTRKISASRARP